MKISIMNNKITKKILIIFFWLVVWEVVSLVVDNSILMAGPIDTVRAIWNNMTDSIFVLTVLNSFFRIGLGFTAAFILGGLFGFLAFKYSVFRDVFMPLVNVIKAIPVASFVVLLLIWAGSGYLAFYISFLITFPNIFINTDAGLRSADEKLLKMSHTFCFSGWETFVFIYRESLKPFIISSVKTTGGMAWKAGVAAEVIGLPQFAIGTQIYNSKIYLETDSLFAWTLMVILLSFIFEKICIILLNFMFNIKPKVRNHKRSRSGEGNSAGLCFENISVKYDEHIILDNISCCFEPGKTYVLRGESGVGKTTLLNEFQKRSNCGAAMVFQEDCLLENYDGITNILLGNDTVKHEVAEDELKRLISQKDLSKPVSEYSGGMKRRIAVLRAVFNGAGLILMDEPFTGLDYENKKELVSLIERYKANRILVVTSHDPEAVMMIHGIEMELQNGSLKSLC